MLDRRVAYQHQSGLLSPSWIGSQTFDILGVGAIGSFFTQTLAKMGAKTITVSDPDTLEEHNISNQGYPMHYIGREKVAALGEIINNDV